MLNPANLQQAVLSTPVNQIGTFPVPVPPTPQQGFTQVLTLGEWTMIPAIPNPYIQSPDYNLTHGIQLLFPQTPNLVIDVLFQGALHFRG